MSQQTCILIVEDEAMIALDMEMQLEDLGHHVIGPVSNSTDARKILEKQKPDAALLDYNLARGETSESVARRMVELDIPFAFLTGHSKITFSDESDFSDIQILTKPCSPRSLQKLISSLLKQRKGIS